MLLLFVPIFVWIFIVFSFLMIFFPKKRNLWQNILFLKKNLHQKILLVSTRFSHSQIVRKRSFLLNRRDVHGYKVTSKYGMKFL